jgi:hypothetical protein
MPLPPDPIEQAALAAVWDSQAAAGPPALDFTRPGFSAPPLPASAEEVASRLRQRLGWPDWVRLYAKPSLAVVAASKLAQARTGAGGVVWAAPGTGAPLEPGRGPNGLMVLRGDWAPHPASMRGLAQEAADRHQLLLIDESSTGLRLARGGAAEFFGLATDLALYGPSLAGGADFAALAGRGEAPPLAKALPGEAALALAAGALAASETQDWPARLAAWGRALALGLEFFGQKTRLGDALGWEGPLALPRLTGKRLWAFRELLLEEGLRLDPLVLFDPALDPAQAPERLWPRLCRAAARLRVLPPGEKAPAGWTESHGVGGLGGGVARVQDILGLIEKP